MAKISHEALALKPFHELAETHGFKASFGQNSANRIPISGGVYYQFGDLRVELPGYTIIVEVESSGGVTNLAKYWECFGSGRLKKPLKLLHIFRQVSTNDYESHLVVWRFLFDKIQADLGDRFEGYCLTYQNDSQVSLDPALEIFSAWLPGRAYSKSFSDF